MLIDRESDVERIALENSPEPPPAAPADRKTRGRSHRRRLVGI
jgi:hypothetical protein